MDAFRRAYVLGAWFCNGLESGDWEFFLLFEHFGREFDDGFNVLL